MALGIFISPKILSIRLNLSPNLKFLGATKLRNMKCSSSDKIQTRVPWMWRQTLNQLNHCLFKIRSFFKEMVSPKVTLSFETY